MFVFINILYEKKIYINKRPKISVYTRPSWRNASIMYKKFPFFIFYFYFFVDDSIINYGILRSCKIPYPPFKRVKITEIIFQNFRWVGDKKWVIPYEYCSRSIKRIPHVICFSTKNWLAIKIFSRVVVQKHNSIKHTTTNYYLWSVILL